MPDRLLHTIYYIKYTVISSQYELVLHIHQRLKVNSRVKKQNKKHASVV